MKTNEKLQIFILPLLGGLFGILSGYVYTLRHDTGTTYALVIGCIVGIIIGAFATKLVRIKLLAFTKGKRRELSLMRVYDRKRKWYLFLIIIIPGIFLTIPNLIIWGSISYYGFFNHPNFLSIVILWGFIYWFLFVLFPFANFKKKSIPFYKQSFLFSDEGFNLKSLESFNLKKKEYFWNSFKMILESIFSASFLFCYPVMIFGVIMAVLFFMFFLVWLVVIISYGIIRGIVALLGKTIFWSSLLVAISVVFYSWNQFSLFISNPLFAIILALITGLFAGVVHRFIVYPLCKWATNEVAHVEKEFSVSQDTFFKATFVKTLGLFWKKSWALAEDKYARKVFKDWDS